MLNHVRNRYALSLLLKKLKFSPVVLIQGARQTGKSFLVRQMLPKTILSTLYKNLDVHSIRAFADRNPDSFVRDMDMKTTLIIDEAQKVPALFDSVKSVVDEERIPGKFILLGSTEFSKLTNIRESLTGRASKLKIFPMTLSETKHLPLNTSKDLLNINCRVPRKDFLKYLRQGGMPGIFGIKNEIELQESLRDWLELASERDALSFRNLKIESNLIKRILESIALNEDTSAGSISKYLKTDLRKIKTHLAVLKTLFIIHELTPHPLSTGKPQYFFCDVGFLNFYNASFEKKIKSFILQEVLAQIYYRQESKKYVYFYRTSKGSIIDLIIVENEKIISCIKITADEKIVSKQFDLLRSFKKQNSNSFNKESRLIGLFGGLEKFKEGQVEFYPWEALS